MAGRILQALFVTVFAGYHLADAELVYLRDVTDDVTTRNLNGGLPSVLTFELSGEKRKLNLRLDENKRLNPNAPMFEGTDGLNGRPIITRRHNAPLTFSRFYQDMTNGGAFYVQCKSAPHGPCVRHLNGNLYIDGVNYDLSPVAPSVIARNYDNLDVHAQPYQLTISSAVLDGDVYKVRATSASDRKYHKDYKEIPKHGSGDRSVTSTIDSLEARVELLLEKLKNERHKRQTGMMVLEILVTLDPSIWEKYFAATSQENGLTRDEATELKLRERFSHVINAISLRYEAIEDPQMDIYLTLSGFLVYKTVNFSNPLSPNVILPKINGRLHADSDVYLDGLVSWADGLTNLPDNDHIMVFTDYVLYYDGDPSNTGVAGIAYLDGVCNGYRVSLQEDANFFQLVTTAAHELGHNLGSPHDEGACPSSAKFIMAPVVATFTSGEAYSINPWRFSSCSIRAFKEYVASLNRDGNNCLLDEGGVFNKAEYNQHISFYPGERYSPDEQCKMIRGDTSSLCSSETDEAICRLMLCSADDGYCYYYAAAMGTPCGRPGTNKWCYEGLCVPRKTVSPTQSTTKRTTPRPTTTTKRTTPRPTTTKSTTTYKTTTTTVRTTTRKRCSWWQWWCSDEQEEITTTTEAPCIDVGYQGVSCQRILYGWFNNYKYYMCWLFETECCATCQ